MPLEEVFDRVIGIFENANTSVDVSYALIVILVILLVIMIANRIVSAIIPRLSRFVTIRTDRYASPDRTLRLRRFETYMSVGVAIFRVLIAALGIYVAWHLIMPSTAPIALVGASAFFIVIAGGTIAPILRNVTYGALMISERWYNVGDHIEVPLYGLSGVVEQVTLHSTKLRSLNGEAHWIHNAHVEAAKVMSRAAQTIAIDIFVTDLAIGRTVIERTIQTLPAGPMMVAKQLTITDTEELGNGLWRISAVGETTLGREWLLEDFAVKTILKYDRETKGGPVIVHGPIAHYTDSLAERRFKRAVQTRG